MLRLILFFCVLLLIQKITMYAQHDYILTSERIDVVHCDDKYMNARIHNFKINRTHTAVNLTLAIYRNLGSGVEFLVQGYKFASNEYREFPLVFRTNICQSIARNDFGVQNLYICGNFFHCPIRKGNYSVCNWGPDYSKFPPYIPSGRYMLDVRGFYNDSIEIMNGQWFIKVETIFPYPK